MSLCTFSFIFLVFFPQVQSNSPSSTCSAEVGVPCFLAGPADEVAMLTDVFKCFLDIGIKALTDVLLAMDREIVLHIKLVKGRPKLREATVHWQVEKKGFVVHTAVC